MKVNVKTVNSENLCSDSQVSQLYQSLRMNDEEGVKTVFNQIDWSQENIDLFQQSILTNNLDSVCFSGDVSP